MSGPASAPLLSEAAAAFLHAARRAVLATTAPDGRSRLVPICFVLVEPTLLYSPIDAKPKRVSDPRQLARLRDIDARPEVAVIVDRWDEDWSKLGWLRAAGRARVLDPAASAERTLAIGLLRAKYPQYADHPLGALPLIRIELTRATWWGSLRPR